MGQHPSRVAAGDAVLPALRAPLTRAIAIGLALDVAAVVLFAVVGRASHAEAMSLLGVARTAWPFLAGVAVGWGAARAAFRAWPLSPRHGIPVWLCTVVVGMLLRSASGQGSAPAFVVVAAAVLGVLLLGWRAVSARSAAHG